MVTGPFIIDSHLHVGAEDTMFELSYAGSRKAVSEVLHQRLRLFRLRGMNVTRAPTLARIGIQA